METQDQFRKWLRQQLEARGHGSKAGLARHLGLPPDAVRFRKSKKIAPGVRLTIGKGSASVRLGGKNAGVSIGTKAKSVSASLPGTGLGIVNQSRKGCFGSLLFIGFVGVGLSSAATVLTQFHF